jgi:PAS domain S-box-containing protein
LNEPGAENLPDPSGALAHVLAQVPAALCYVDGGCRFRYANERFLEWTVLLYPEGILGMHVAEVIGRARWESLRSDIELTLAGRPTRTEDSLIGPDGERHHLEHVMVPDVRDGEILGFVLMITDVTRRHQAESALEQERREVATRLEAEVAERTRQLRELQGQLMNAERLSAAEQMAGAVAHGINNPLTALLGTVEMAQREMLGLNSALERVRVLAKRIEDVVQGTLWQYRREPPP